MQSKKMKFSEAYQTVNKMFRKWGQKGIALSGETNTAWLFKSHVSSNDPTSGGSIIVNRDNGNMRIFNIGYPEDREEGENAVILDKKTVEERLKAKI